MIGQRIIEQKRRQKIFGAYIERSPQSLYGPKIMEARSNGIESWYMRDFRVIQVGF